MATFNLLAPDGIGIHGRPSPLVDVRVVDPDDARGRRPARPARSSCAARTVMCGYWNRPELNAHRSRGGWHHTNDLGRYEADGTFTFVGPKSADAEVGRGEHLPGRGRELPEDASRRSPTAR